MISTANITMQFGEKPLFENISVKFQDGPLLWGTRDYGR